MNLSRSLRTRTLVSAVGLAVVCSGAFFCKASRSAVWARFRIECTAGVPAGCSGARGVSCGTEGGGTSWDGSCFTTGDCTEGVAGVDGVEGGSVGSEGAIGEGTVGFVGVTWAVAAGVAGEVPGPVSCGIFLVLFCLFFFFTCLVFLARLFCVFFAPFFGCTLFLVPLGWIVVLCCALLCWFGFVHQNGYRRGPG